MSHFVLSTEAEFDLLDIWDFIEHKSKNSDIADKFLVYVYGLLDNLAEAPGMGRIREDLRPGLRSYPFPHHDYIVYYSLREEGIYINRVIQGNRNQQKQFN